MASEQFIKIRNLIEKELSHAVTKHPKFCDHFIDESARTWAEAEMLIKEKEPKKPRAKHEPTPEEIEERKARQRKYSHDWYLRHNKFSPFSGFFFVYKFLHIFIKIILTSYK